MAFEAARPSGNWILRGVLALAAVVIGIGVIALIAANWDAIPDMVKLGADFAFLAGLVFAVLAMKRRGSEIGVEVLLVSFMFGCLATIGLIGQIFHTDGRLDVALLFWSAMPGPAALMSRRRLVSSLWSWTLLGASCAWIVRIVDEKNFWLFEAYLTLWILLSLPFVCYLAAAACRRVAGKENFVWSLRTAMIVSWVGAIAIFDLALSELFIGFGLGPAGALLLAVAIVPAAAALAVARRTEGLPRYRLRLLVSAVGVFLLMGNLAGGYVDIPFGGLAFSVTLIGMAAIDLGIQGRRGMFQFLLVLIGVRFLIFYVLYVGGLALTAAGLIGSGLLILLVAWGWHRNRSRLQGWLEGMAP